METPKLSELQDLKVENARLQIANGSQQIRNGEQQIAMGQLIAREGQAKLEALWKALEAEHPDWTIDRETQQWVKKPEAPPPTEKL